MAWELALVKTVKIQEEFITLSSFQKTFWTLIPKILKKTILRPVPFAKGLVKSLGCIAISSLKTLKQSLFIVVAIFAKSLRSRNKYIHHPQDICMEDTYIDQAYGFTLAQFLRIFTSTRMSGVIKLLETKKLATGHFLFLTGANQSSPKVIVFKAD
ncbi:hypothetical protein SELMODRAFT_427335 [Selaginella moellendorffii]|uniref:Uncharacterized protein n=1 Tax=Selaginella moellendorffii TaxID=88036 RepID=D8SZ91_SELML|nr:hypothetical protein SELMODRAFT_427335 [Selaginella moellendorffii]